MEETKVIWECEEVIIPHTPEQIKIMNRLAQEERFKQKLLQEFLKDKSSSEIMEYAELLPSFDSNREYQVGEIVRSGLELNVFGEPQLLRIDKTRAGDIFGESIGTAVDDYKTPVWTQPLTEFDKYEEGDVVIYPCETGIKYQSKINNNAYEPDNDKDIGWEVLKKG